MAVSSTPISPLAQATPREQPKILLIDDDQGVLHQLLVFETLTRGHRVRCARDDAAAERVARSFRPNLLVVTGGALEGALFERIARFRNAGNLFCLPILIVSPDAEGWPHAEVLRFDDVEFVHPPFAPAELRARVGRLTDAHRARGVLRRTFGGGETSLVALAARARARQAGLEADLDDARRARDRAEHANRLKDEFLRTVSHELKDPITALLLQQQLLHAEPYVRQAPPAIARGFAGIARSVSRLLHLVDTALGWTRVEAGRSEPALTVLDLSRLVQMAVAECQPQAEAKGIELIVRVPDSAVIASDDHFLRLIVINLLEHAIGAVREGAVTVELMSDPVEPRIRVTYPGRPWYAEGAPHQLDDGRVGAGLELGDWFGLRVIEDLARAIGASVAVVQGDRDDCVLELSVSQLTAEPTAHYLEQ